MLREGGREGEREGGGGEKGREEGGREEGKGETYQNMHSIGSYSSPLGCWCLGSVPVTPPHLLGCWRQNRRADQPSPSQ